MTMGTPLAWRVAAFTSAVARSAAHRQTCCSLASLGHTPFQRRCFTDDGEDKIPKSHEQQMLAALQEQNSLLKSLLNRVENIEETLQQCSTNENRTPLPTTFQKRRPQQRQQPRSAVPISGAWTFRPPQHIRQRLEQEKEQAVLKGQERIDWYVKEKLNLQAKLKELHENAEQGNIASPEEVEAIETEIEELQATYNQQREQHEQEEKERLDKDALPLYGRVESGQVLKGVPYPGQHAQLFSYKKPSHQAWAPLWSYYKSIGHNNDDSVRNVLAEIAFNYKTQIPQKSGIYYLLVRFNRSGTAPTQEAGIIIGEIEFNSAGFAVAQGADWDRLLAGKPQHNLPYAHGARGIPKWVQRKVSEPWQDGDKLRFWVDTHENTLTFQRNDLPEKKLTNVLAFTNNPVYPDYLRAFGYCGGLGPGHYLSHSEGPLDVKLTIIPM